MSPAADIGDGVMLRAEDELGCFRVESTDEKK